MRWTKTDLRHNLGILQENVLDLDGEEKELIVTLLHFKQLSYREIASILGCSHTTVQNILDNSWFRKMHLGNVSAYESNVNLKERREMIEWFIKDYCLFLGRSLRIEERRNSPSLKFITDIARELVLALAAYKRPSQKDSMLKTLARIAYFDSDVSSKPSKREIARKLKVDHKTVSKWLQDEAIPERKFLLFQERLDILQDYSKPYPSFDPVNKYLNFIDETLLQFFSTEGIKNLPFMGEKALSPSGALYAAAITSCLFRGYGYTTGKVVTLKLNQVELYG
jgi:hypothetical protein